MCEECQQYSPLHLHTQYSIDSVTSIEDLHKYILEKKFKHVAITDHASLSGVVEHYKYGIENYNNTGLGKPLTGCEIYLYWDNSPFPEGQHYPNGKKRLAHLTLLADGDVGYKTLVNLLNRAKLRAEYGFRSPVYMSELMSNNEGLYCLTGCPASIAQDDNKNIAFTFVEELKHAFGNRLYAEGQFHNMTSAKHFDRAIELHNRFKLPLAFTNDCHYINIDNVSEYQKFKNWVFGGKDDEDENFSLTMLYLATSDEVIEHTRKISSLTGFDYMPYVKDAMANTLEIGDKLGIVDMSQRKPIFPEIPNADNVFDDLIKEGVEYRQIDLTNNVYYDRLQKEIKVIKAHGFVPYFIVVSDLCSFAKSNNLIGGVGRGSAAGSLVSYILGITHLDPIEYNLTFERFLSEHRKALPDIDSDFSGEARDKIVDYAQIKWGFKPVATYVYFGNKEAINFAIRHCGLDFKVANIAINDFRDALETNNIDLDSIEDEDDFPKVVKDLFKKYDSYRLYELYKFVHNKCKTVGQHPGGIVYVDDLAPLENKTNGGVVVALPEGKHGEYLSYRGYVKIDILGIGTLKVIEECYNLTSVLPPPPKGKELAIDLLNQNKNSGIFQFKGAAMTNLLSKFRPQTFIDLVVMNGAGRGGADTDMYLEYRDSGKSLVWGNDIDNICSNTYGIPIFQEQFMSIYALLLGTVFDDPAGRVDKMRKQIAKFRSTPEGFKKKDELKKEILDLAKNNLGLSNDKSNLLWSFFDIAHGYSFNLAHSTCYSYIAWQLLWYKYNYPLEFYAATLNACYVDDMQSNIDELYREDVEIVNPDICNSSDVWRASDGKIYAPFTIIKSLGDKAAKNIVLNRPYNSAQHFMETVNLRQVNSGVRYKLYMTGAFNCFADITGNWEDDSKILDISKYDGNINKQQYQAEVFEVNLLEKENVDKLNQFIKAYEHMVDSNSRIVYGKIGYRYSEMTQTGKELNDKIKYKLKTSSDKKGKFLAWFSQRDLNNHPILHNLVEGTYFVSLISYGRINPNYLLTF